MIQLYRILLISYITLVVINCQQTKNEIETNQIPNAQYQNLAPPHIKGIHETHSLYYKNKSESIKEKLKVLNGIDVLLEKKLHFIKSRKIALVTNHSGVDKNLVPNYKRLMGIEDVELKVIFSPEHGLFGESEAGEKINYSKIEKLLNDNNVYFENIGVTQKDHFELDKDLKTSVKELYEINNKWYNNFNGLIS